MRRFVFHVDVDQFIAAVEVLRRPDLEGKPVVVGGIGDPTKRGVVSTASYEARRFGVHSGMALRTAARRCPDAVFLPVDRDAYEAASTDVMATLRTFPAVVEVAGWDEAFLEAATDDPEALARAVQAAVTAGTGLTCSVGIGFNKLQAKIASDVNKPEGVFRLTDENWMEVMGHLSTEALWGIGRKSRQRLEGLGIRTVAELAAASEDRLIDSFGPRTGPWLKDLGRGRSGSRVSAEPHEPKSRGREVTFDVDIADRATVLDEVRRLAAEVADDLRAMGREARRVTLKIRFAPFQTYTRTVTLASPSAASGPIAAAAVAALDSFDDDRPVRLVGVTAMLASPPEGFAPRPGEGRRPDPPGSG